jgi:ribosomal protein S18 acetylase RimI-like enzyme
MNENQITDISLSEIRFIPLKRYSKHPQEFKKCIDGVNKLRSNYPYSKKQYTEENIENVYLITNKKNGIMGFFECKYDYLEITDYHQIEVFIDELHISPPIQNKGIGKYVIDNLLKKICKLRFVIAKENKKVNGLIKKYNHEVKYDNQNTQTIIIRRQTIKLH